MPTIANDAGSRLAGMRFGVPSAWVGVRSEGVWLQARFVTNPFYAAKGAYRGLFEDTNAVSHERSGSITVTGRSS